MVFIQKYDIKHISDYVACHPSLLSFYLLYNCPFHIGSNMRRTFKVGFWWKLFIDCYQTVFLGFLHSPLTNAFHLFQKVGQ